jgi:hypothetical protein
LAYILVRQISDISTRINDVSNRWIDKDQILCLISPSSTGKNAEIVRPDVMTRVRTWVTMFSPTIAAFLPVELGLIGQKKKN